MTDTPTPPAAGAAEGFHYEAAEQGPEWTAGNPTGRTCRRSGCGKTAVARLRRRDARTVAGVPWYYCAEHMYGRWIENGKVMGWRLVADADERLGGV